MSKHKLNWTAATPTTTAVKFLLKNGDNLLGRVEGGSPTFKWTYQISGRYSLVNFWGFETKDDCIKHATSMLDMLIDSFGG